MSLPIKEKMEKTIETLKRELISVRAGRATPALLDRVSVDYYGTPTPVNQLANITVPEPRLLVIQPWDKGIIQEIEKAIQKSDLGLNPMNDGSVIRIVIPPMTEERRLELVKLVRKMGEDAKVAIRNLRRDANDEIRKQEKAGELSTDESRRKQDEVQKLTDQYIQEVDKLVRDKEQEIMEV
ncbi:MAG: ribosome recycling factor [Bacillus thermozeamaize]|uniref:Ribosome-recycling factor n=1 Tax=Bacillus thermozeamaize TaxID=230954 RepID=A0A1Y3PM22_9BACI|nr:MAG: ribosome recycling factor [Bacillus thermozeamaize]